MDRVDYFDAQEARRRLEAALDKHIIAMPEDSIAVSRPPKETLADYVLRRRAELEKQVEELAFIQDVAELMRKHPKYFEGSK